MYLSVFCAALLMRDDRNKKSYKDILKVGLGALGGLAAGYGLGKMKGKKRKKKTGFSLTLILIRNQSDYACP